MKEWILAFSALGGTFIITPALRQILKRLQQNGRWPILTRLAPTVTNLLYVLGFRLFAEIAPLPPRLETWIDGGIYVFSIIIYLQLILRAALIGIEWSSTQTHHSEVLHTGFIPLLKNIITLFVFFSAGIMILKHFNYDVMSLVTALGVSSLAVGLAAKDTLSNMISGFILIIDRNLSPGDRINLSGAVGDVRAIGLRSTQIRMADGNTLIVPNSELVNTRLMNQSIPSREVTCTLFLKVPYSVSFPQVKELCLMLLKDIEKISSDKPTWVNLASLSDGYQLIQVGFWVRDLNHTGSATSEFHEKILARFKEDQIPLVSLPIPLPGSAAPG